MTGFEEGDRCNRVGCEGVIATHPPENCSCHISAPCSACVSPRNYCPVCDWQEKDDVIIERINDHVTAVKKDGTFVRSYGLRTLNPNKLDYHSFGHTHFSMIKRGVYPEGMTIDEVREQVKGTFGGRFNYFRNGKFEYVAYTD